MHTDHNKPLYLASLIILSVIMALHDGIMYWKQIVPAPGLDGLYLLCSTLLLVLWVDADSKTQPNTLRPFRYSFLLWIFITPYLPIYLWKTRRSKGMLMLFGFLILFSLGSFAQLAVYFILKQN